MDCLFCNIISGKIPSKKVFENEHVFAFEDINPQSPVHILVVPKQHVANIGELDGSNIRIMDDLFIAVKEISMAKGLSENGYRIIINNGKAAGQVIWHLHIHILGGTSDLGPMLCNR